MNLAVSNLAWDFNENNDIYGELKNLGIYYIEGVLTKINDWSNLTDDNIIDFKTNLEFNNIKIQSIQSIFHNVKVESLHNTDAVFNHIKKLIHYCNLLDVNIMVLGSPTLRRLNNKTIYDLTSTLKLLDEILIDNNIQLCLEPNAKIYGGHYFFTIEEIISFLNKVKFKNIKTMIDTHNMMLENDNPSEFLEKYFNEICHIHISEPDLSPLYNLELHYEFSNKIKEIKYDKIVTLEMKKSDNLIDDIKKFSLIYNKQ